MADLNTGRPPTGMPEVACPRYRKAAPGDTADRRRPWLRPFGDAGEDRGARDRGAEVQRRGQRHVGVEHTFIGTALRAVARQQQASVSRPSRHCPATSTRRQRRPTGPDGREWGHPQAPEDNAPNSADDELPLAAPEAGEAPRSDPASKSRSGQPDIAADDDLSSAEMEQESRGWQIATGAETGTGRRPTGTPHQKERADVIQNRLLPQHK